MKKENFYTHNGLSSLDGDFSIMKQCKRYWEVSPPFLAKGEVGTLEWSKSITEHRYNLAPYLRSWMAPEAYSGKKVLEIGYGSGSDLIEYAKAGAEVYGVDITEMSLDITNKRLNVEGLSASLYTYNGIDFPPLLQDFDLIYSYGVLHHTPYIDNILANVYSLLNPNGTLKLMIYNRFSLLYYYSILYQNYQERLDRDALLSWYSEFREGCPYTRVFSVNEIMERLWYFKDISAYADFLVYDYGNDRKIKGGRRIDFDKTGVVDIDTFLEKYNKDVENRDPRIVEKYGWHLLVDAHK